MCTGRFAMCLIDWISHFLLHILLFLLLLLLLLLFCSHRLIANSAPLINTVVTVGCIMLLVACYLLGIDSGTPSVVPDDVPRQDILNDGNLNDYGRTRYAILCSVGLCVCLSVSIRSHFLSCTRRQGYGSSLSDLHCLSVRCLLRPGRPTVSTPLPPSRTR